MEVPLSGARMVLLVGLLSFPALAQQSTLSPQLPGRNWSMGPTVHPEPLRQSDLQAVRLQTIHEDAEKLSALSGALQSELQQLQRGVFPQNMGEDLKKMEKLSKKLRQEMTGQ